MSRRIAYPPSIAARDVVISVNPRAGARSRRAHVDAISAAIAAAGFRVQTLADLNELAKVTTESSSSGQLRAVVAIGGDGTASIVRHHVPLDIPLVPVPMGTENLLGRYVGQGTSPKAIVETLEHGVSVGLDLMRAGDRHFLLMISVGFDAEVIRRLHETRSGNITRLSYAKPTFSAMRSYTYPELQVYCDATSGMGDAPLRCKWMFGFNLPLYACGWQLTPDATGTDGLLDVCLFERGSIAGVLRYLWHVTRRGHHLLADTTTTRGRQFRIESSDSANVAYQLDGDFGGTLPVDVDVLPGELRLLVSQSIAAKLGFAKSGEIEKIMSSART